VKIFSLEEKQGDGVCIEFPLFEGVAQRREISERLETIIKDCQYFKRALAGTDGILLHARDVRNNEPVISKNIGVSQEKYDYYASLIRETLAWRGANLIAEANIDREKPPAAALAFGDLLLIVAGLQEERSAACLFAIAVKAGLMPIDLVPGEKAA
jgi:hypothetical protein